LLAERSLEPSEQLVERRCEAPELVARIRHREALGQILSANLAGAVRHRHHGREAPACQEPAAEPGNDQRKGHDVREDPSQRRQFLVERLHRTADHHHVVGGARQSRPAHAEPVTIIVIDLVHALKQHAALRNRRYRGQHEFEVAVAAALGERLPAAVVNRDHLPRRRELADSAPGGITIVLAFLKIIGE
jgi:hypothetical protein